MKNINSYRKNIILLTADLGQIKTFNAEKLIVRLFYEQITIFHPELKDIWDINQNKGYSKYDR